MSKNFKNVNAINIINYVIGIFIFLSIASFAYNPHVISATNSSDSLIDALFNFAGTENEASNTESGYGDIYNIEANSNIVANAERVAATLEIGSCSAMPYLNKHIRTISNGSYTTPRKNGIYCRVSDGSSVLGTDGIFWCTHMVVTSYKLSGYNFFDEVQDAAVVRMQNTVKSLQDSMIYINYATNKQAGLRSVKPGCAFFFKLGDRWQHTGIVREIVLDENGNGALKTYESNRIPSNPQYPIVNYQIENIYGGRTLDGFGCIK